MVTANKLNKCKWKSSVSTKDTPQLTIDVFKVKKPFIND